MDRNKGHSLAVPRFGRSNSTRFVRNSISATQWTAGIAIRRWPSEGKYSSDQGLKQDPGGWLASGILRENFGCGQSIMKTERWRPAPLLAKWQRDSSVTNVTPP